MTWRSIRCGECGFATEEDWFDTPEELRDLLLKRDGEFAVLVPDLSRLTAARVIARGLTKCEIHEMLALRQTAPNCVGRGTRGEADRLWNVLRNDGIGAEVVQVDHR